MDRQLGQGIGNHSLVILSRSSIHGNPSSKNADYLLYSPNIQLTPAGFLGIRMDDTDNGVKIVSVLKKGAAEQAGIKANDVIVAFNNQTIKDTSDVSLWRLDKKPGDKVTIKLRRHHIDAVKRVSTVNILTKTLVLGKPMKHSTFNFSRLRKK